MFFGLKPSQNIEKSSTSQIDNLHLGIRDFVRGRLFRCILTSLVPHVADRLQANRVADNFHFHPEQHFSEIYDSLNDQAKVFTRPFWEMVQYLNWSMMAKDNEIFDRVRIGSMENFQNIIIGESYKVRYVTTDQLVFVTKSLNLAIFTATRQMGYNGGNLPMEAFGTFLPELAFPGSVEHTSGKSEEIDTPMTEMDIKSTSAACTTYDESEPAPRNHMDCLSTAAINGHSEVPKMSHSPKEHDEVKSKLFSDETEVSREVGYDFSVDHGMFPHDEIISPDSTLFSLTRLFSQIDDYLHAICAECLHKGPFTVSSICDTLLSLSDKEYAFLPLWAGGMNDGSGGVFADEIPPAQRGGPSEPGPAYHTGSTVNSTASSECDFDGERYSFLSGSGSKSGDTSMDVENGERTYGGRGSVLSEDEFPISEGYSEVAFREEEELVAATEVPRAGIVVPIPSSYIEDENFFNAPDEESEEELDWDVLGEEDDGDETETEN